MKSLYAGAGVAGLAALLAATAGAQGSGSAPLTIPGTEWRLVPQASASLTYDDNVFITPSNRISDTYAQLVPGLAVGIGPFNSQVAPYADFPHFLASTFEEQQPDQADSPTNFAFAAYAPDFELFVRHPHDNTINHDVRAAIGGQSERWRAGASFHFAHETSPNLYVGGRARESFADENAHAQYDFTGKITAGLEFVASEETVTGASAHEQELATVFADYRVTDKTEAGLAIGAGGLQVRSDPDLGTVDPGVRLRYQASAKVWLSAEAGAELVRGAGGRADQNGGRFDVSGAYAATESTTWVVGARRGLEPAIEYHDANIWESVCHGGVRQRAWGEFIFSADGGFVWDQYRWFDPAAALPRRDRYYYVRPALGHDVTRNGTVQLSWEHRQDDSTTANVGFIENLVTLSASFLF